jgi:hypothetical protein
MIVGVANTEFIATGGFPVFPYLVIDYAGQWRPSVSKPQLFPRSLHTLG